MRSNNRKPSSFNTIIVLLCIALFNLPFNMALVVFAVMAPAAILAIILHRVAKRKMQEQNRQTNNTYTTDTSPSQVYDNSEGYENYSSQESYDSKERYGNHQRSTASVESIPISQNEEARLASELKDLLKAGIIDKAEYNDRMRAVRDR